MEKKKLFLSVECEKHFAETSGTTNRSVLNKKPY